MYRQSILTKNKQITSSWSGGHTTQLAIYPIEASVENQNFVWRVSIAQSYDEETIFTPFLGYKRKLLVLDGNLTLSSADHNYHQKLNPSEQTEFDGGRVVKSLGKTLNFNLVFSKHSRGDLKEIKVTETPVTETLEGWSDSTYNQNVELFYCQSKSAVVKIEKQENFLEQGDVLLIERTKDPCAIPITYDEFHSQICRASVYYNVLA